MLLILMETANAASVRVNAFESSEVDEILHEEDILFDSDEDVVGEEDGGETDLFVQRGITRVGARDPRYKAATNLIATVRQDSLQQAPAGTIVYLRNLRNVYPYYSNYNWANSARLDNQGDYKEGNAWYARLAVQISDYTVAQANVKIGARFGQRRIRNALVQSLNGAEVVYLRN
eukprot:Em0005g972a